MCLFIPTGTLRFWRNRAQQLLHLCRWTMAARTRSSSATWAAARSASPTAWAAGRRAGSTRQVPLCRTAMSGKMAALVLCVGLLSSRGFHCLRGASGSPSASSRVFCCAACLFETAYIVTPFMWVRASSIREMLPLRNLWGRAAVSRPRNCQLWTTLMTYCFQRTARVWLSLPSPSSVSMDTPRDARVP